MAGKVVTFYSFKGGTGRTMALANAAVVIAQESNDPVLMIDWDLEAPGLHRFFPRPTNAEDPGLIELMVYLRDRIEADGLDGRDEGATRELIGQIPLDDFITPVGGERLTNLSAIYAGRTSDPSYPTRVNTFDWELLYERAPYLFKAFAHELAERYGHVMIDSRTGVTDTGGICTTLMPEKLVMVFTPNRQSLLGIVDRSENAVRYRQQGEDLRPLTIFPLASRVELSQEPLRSIWRHGGSDHDIGGYQPMFEVLFRDIYALESCDLTSYFDEVQIQHVPYYSYGEEIAVLDSDAPRDRLSLRTSYEHFAHTLSRVDAPWQYDSAGRLDGRRLRFNVPVVLRDFIGRERELAEVARFLADRAPGLQMMSILGLGGVGKTQIATRCVQTDLDEHETVAWISAEDGGIRDLCRLAAALDLHADGESPRALAEAALLELSRSTGRWVLVLDGIASPDQLASCCPPSGNGRVLITSRHRGLDQFGSSMTVDVFDPDTAESFLMARASQAGEPLWAARLAATLGCLPWGLSQAAAYCARGTTFAGCMELLDTLPVEALFDSAPDATRAQAGASIWQTSIAAAGADSKLAPNVLAMAAYMAADDIPKALFDVLLDDDGPKQRKRLADALNALGVFSLATTEDATLSVHRLLQKAVRDHRAAQHDNTAALNALVALDHAFPVEPSLPASWPVCEQLLPHALALADTSAVRVETIDLLNRVGMYLIWSNPADRSLAVARATCGHAERILGLEHRSTLTARRIVALASLQAGLIHEGLEILEPLLRNQERLLGADHADTLGTRNDLAGAYQDAGRSADAIAIYEPLLADFERVLGEAHPDVLAARNNLASAYQDAGRTPDAIEIYEPLLNDQQRILGTEHPATLTTRNNLANAYQAAGRTPDAIEIYEPLLNDQQRILGTEHPATLTTRNNLANAYQDAGRTADAIEIYEPLLNDQQRILGTEHPATLTTRNNLASALQSAGRRSAAIAIYKQLLNDQERILGTEHPNTRTTRNNLVNAYHSSGRSDDAIALSAHESMTRDVDAEPSPVDKSHERHSGSPHDA